MGVIKKIVRLTIKQKSEILKKLTDGGSVNSICKAYNVNKSTVCRIKKQRDALSKFVANCECGPGKRCTIRSAEYPKMEKALHSWFLCQRKHNVPMSGDIIKQKARNLHNKFKEKPGGFNASDGWLKNFKKRYGIRYLKVCGEKLTNKPHLIEPFKENFQKKITELGLTSDQIYNADESGLYYRLLPDHTFVSSSEKCAPGRKLCKERITFMPCTNVSGTHKVKLLVIGKSLRPRALNNFHNNPVVYKANRNAWMTRLLFEEWFQNVFVPEVREFLASKGLHKKALLLLDNAPCHPKDGELQSDDGSITIMCLPPNCTALLQPMDQCLIKTIKNQYKKSLLADLVGTQGSDLNEKLKNYNLKHALCNLANAWGKVPASSIQRSWNNLMSENNCWSEEDDLPLSSIREQMINENLYVSSILHEICPTYSFSLPNIIRWESEDCVTPYESENDNEDQIQEEAENSDEEDSVVAEPKIKTDDAIQSINICLQWASQNNCPINQILALKDLKEAAIVQKVKKAKVQSTISNFFKKM